MTAEEAFSQAIQAHRAGRAAEAIDLLERAGVMRSADAEAQIFLGDALREVGRTEDAIAAYRRAAASAGAAPKGVGARAEGLAVTAWLKLGATLLGARQFKQSIEATTKGIALRPGIAAAHSNLSRALCGDGQYEAALETARQCVALQPEFVEGWHGVALALAALDRLGEAADAYRRALAVRRADAPATGPAGAAEAQIWFELGRTLFQDAKLDDAVAAYRRAIELRPVYPNCHLSLALALRAQGKADESIAANREALKQLPDFGESLMSLGDTLRDVGRLDEALDCYTRGQRLPGTEAAFARKRLFTLLFHPDFDAAALLREQREWDRVFAQPLRAVIAPHRNDRAPERRLRVGYVSGDFRDHVVGRNLLPVIRDHDRQAVEVTCYSNGPAEDDWTRQFRAAADRWREVRALGDEAMAQRVREDEIDIFVDLSMHMSGNRLLVFARKPAPVQVTCGAYPGGTGLGTMDWRLTDVYLNPPGVGDDEYVERSMRLPDSFWCYDAKAMEAPDEAEAGPLPAVANGFITFGCLNSFAKVSDGSLALWARAMAAVPRSRLLVMAAPGSARARVIARLNEAGVDAARVEFVGFQKRATYLRTYERIDIGLDTLPYNGHTTSLDAMWMGVPIVTLVGKTVVGRAGLSQLSNLGLTELVAKTPEEFVEIAVGLAGDLGRLAELRRGMRERMRRSPLTDARRFARNIEAAYRAMWREWCEGGR